jgi:hypothetical protein
MSKSTSSLHMPLPTKRLSWSADATALFWHANLSDISVGQVSTSGTRFTALNGLSIHGQLNDHRKLKRLQAFLGHQFAFETSLKPAVAAHNFKHEGR